MLYPAVRWFVSRGRRHRCCPKKPPTPPPTPGTADPGSILGLLALLAWWRGDEVTLAGSDVVSAYDKTGHGYTLITTAGTVPWSAAGGPSSQPMWSIDGAADTMLAAALDRPAPSAERTYVAMVLRQQAWTAGRSVFIVGQTANPPALVLRQIGASPALAMVVTAASPSNSAAVLGQWVRLEALFTGSVSDFLKVLGTNATGNSGDNDPPTGFTIGGSVGAGGGAVFDFAEGIVVAGEPTASQRQALDVYWTSRYGAAVVA